MRTILRHSRMARACAVAGALATPVAWAQFEPPVEALEANLVGLGVGSVPDYSGSSHNEAAVAPILRYQFEGSNRYVLW
jgi:outer membrane scaffolding protein for murein synthesis (MipA/OmpV family)